MRWRVTIEGGGGGQPSKVSASLTLLCVSLRGAGRFRAVSLCGGVHSHIGELNSSSICLKSVSERTGWFLSLPPENVDPVQ